MEETGPSRARDGEPTGDEATGTGAAPARPPSWSRRLGESERRSDGDPERDGRLRTDGTGPPARRRSPELGPEAPRPGETSHLLDDGIDRLRRIATEAARADAEMGLPPAEDPRITERETSLRERCRNLFERSRSSERRRLQDELIRREEQVSGLLGRAGLLLDRFERLCNELIRLKARFSSHRREVEASLQERETDDGDPGQAGLSTRVYVAAISFLGLVEFFANAPVFSTLLPRDPLTERQIRVLSETSAGWLAGVERVLAQLVLRPDAALLAAGVVTFLCVLAHFFGHSLREYVTQKDRGTRRDTTTPRSPLENAVPMVLTGLGLVLVLGVLFEARVILGEVGERRYREDMASVAELRREAGWLRADGDLLAANERADRADDMEAAATDLREYAASMSRMTFPILLLNLTLVLAAITAAYFHDRGGSRQKFNENPYEDDRERLIERAETTASEVSDLLVQVVRPIRELRSIAEAGLARDSAAVIERIESVVSRYRRENARIRDIAVEGVAAFEKPVALNLRSDAELLDGSSYRDAAEAAESERRSLQERFRENRQRFNRQLLTWDPDGDDA